MDQTIIVQMGKTTEIAKKVAFVLLLILPAFVIQLAAQTVIVTNLVHFIQTYLAVYVFILLIVKAVSIVYPPLPGVAFTIASIPLIGWELAYVVDIAGSTLGASMAFYLGNKYGYSILQRVIGRTITDKIGKIKLKQRNQIEAAIFLRFAAGGMLSDGLAWGAGLIGFRYLPFVTGYLISHVITTLPIFYFVAASVSFNSWIIITTVGIFAWFIIFKFKGRYFD